jgi:hypothetical protein
VKTYLSVTFSSEGAKPSAIDEALAGLGFRPTTGAHDWTYDWPSSASVEDVLEFGDRIHAALQGMGTMWQMETV